MLQAFDIAAHVYSLTSVQQLYRNAEQYEHHEKASRLETILKQSTGPIVVATDWVPEYPSLLGRFCKNRDVHVLGTPGFGLSDTRESLRAYFGIDAYHITKTALNALVQNDQIPASTFHDFIQANKPAHS
jgi:pyruvate dehydrogenase E1 component